MIGTEAPRVDEAGKAGEAGEGLVCHACNATIEGEPAGHGLLMFVRGDTVEYEQPPLCARCALAIGMTARYRWEIEEEEG